MAEETITILKVGTEEAVRSVNDLKENIKALKQNLGELEIGTEEYQSTLEELKVNQNALKDAMYATTSSMADVAAAATGASNSYNSLVHTMAALKEEWRATNDEARRNELGVQIAEINQQLKDMDASVGNFQRNVGNYESGVSGLVEKFDTWGETLKMMPPTLGAAKESIGKVGEAMQLVGKQPILGIIGLLAPIIIKITESLKENETAMGAVKKVMASLEPVFGLFEQVLDKIAQGVAKVAEWFVTLLGESGETFKNIISGAVGVGNVLLQYMLTPIRSAIEAFKGLGKIIGDVFKGNFKDIKNDAEEAWGGIKDTFVKGFSFKQNFDLGKRVGEEFAAGLSSSKSAVAKEAEDMADNVAKAVETKLKTINFSKIDNAFTKNVAKEREAALKDLEETNDLLEEDIAETTAEIDAVFQENLNNMLGDMQKSKEYAQAKVDAMYSVADATSSVLGSLASMYESDEKNAEKNAKKIKALRISEATINTISGAIGAFTQATATMPPPIGAIVGAVQAAAVTAAGLAQIAQIRKTNVSASGGSSSGNISAPSASVSAPNVETNLQSVRSVTTASEEERLNQMAKDQRVYIVSSDIEAALDDNKTRVAESSF